MAWMIVCDSSCEIRELEHPSAGVQFALVPFKIRVGEREYVDLATLNVPQMLQAMTDYNGASTTACPSPEEWAEYFLQADNCIALTISSKEHKNYQLGSRVNLAFAGGGTAQGTVVRTELSDDGSAMMLVIRGDTVTEDTVSRRAATVRLSSENYTGVRFDKEYLRIVDGVKGVYVDNGYSVKFKTVDIIYEGDTYYLSRLNYTGEEQLNIFDKLIASKTELYDGMPLSDL